MAAQNAVAKQAYALITLFEQCFEKKYHRKPQINRFREKWGFQDMVTDLGYSAARETVEYYLKTGKQGHPVAFLLQNYDKVNQFMEEKKRDEANRAELRKQTAQKVKEWEEKNG
jgi:ribosomal protein S15P/S13E